MHGNAGPVQRNHIDGNSLLVEARPMMGGRLLGEQKMDLVPNESKTRDAWGNRYRSKTSMVRREK